MLPDAGLKGNTHIPFADMNNVAVSDLLSKILARTAWTSASEAALPEFQEEAVRATSHNVPWIPLRCKLLRRSGSAGERF